MATDTSTWTNYWNSDDYNEWQTATTTAWGDASTRKYNSDADRETFGWDSEKASGKNGTRITGNVFGGMASGAVAGLALGGIGALIGGFLGGILGGLFGLGNDNTEAEKRQYNSYLNQIIYQKENLTAEYNQSLEKLQRERDNQLEQLNTLNERYQKATDRTVVERDSQEQVTATEIYAQSKENTSQIREAQTNLIKETASKTSQLATSGFRNTGSAQNSIAYYYEEGEKNIEEAKYQMDTALYVSNSQMANNYTSSTYKAYSYQDTISDNITTYKNWLAELEASISTLNENYEREMEKYNQALEELTHTQDYNAFGAFLSGFSSGASSILGLGVRDIFSGVGSLLS